MAMGLMAVTPGTQVVYAKDHRRLTVRACQPVAPGSTAQCGWPVKRLSDTPAGNDVPGSVLLVLWPLAEYFVTSEHGGNDIAT